MILPMTEPLAHPLTPREVQVLRCLADGLSRFETGAQLGISPATVKTHKARIFGKLHVHRKAEAVAWAFRAGLLS